MARIWVGATAIVDTTGQPVSTPGALISLWLTQAGGTRITDVLDATGQSVPGGLLAADEDGLVPLCQPEAGQSSSVFASVDDGPRQVLHALAPNVAMLAGVVAGEIADQLAHSSDVVAAAAAAALAGLGMVPARVIGAAVDLDAVEFDAVSSTPGAGASWAALHYPAAVAGTVQTFRIVAGSDAHAVQMFTTTDGRYYSRVKSVGVWGAWAQIGAPALPLVRAAATDDLDVVAMDSFGTTAGATSWAASHYPAAVAGQWATFRLVAGSDAHAVQWFVTRESPPRLFVRPRTSGVWGAWAQIGAPALPAVYGTADLNLDTAGTRRHSAAAFTNGPTGMAAGWVETNAIVSGNTNYLVQFAVEWTYGDTPARIWTRTKTTTGWRAWTLIGPIATSDFAVVAAARPGSGLKQVTCPVTLGHNPSGYAATNGGSARLPQKWGTNPTRVRPSFADIDIRSGTWGTASGLSITGVWVGAWDEATSTVSGLVKISNGGAVPVGGTWVGAWAPFPPSITGPWVLCYSWTGQPSYMQRAYGQLHPDPAQAGLSGTTGWTTTTLAVPFAATLNVEIPATTPVIMYVGDSLVCGQGATRGVYEAWSMVHARACGAVPVLAASAGDTVTGMSSLTAYKWTRFDAAMARPDCILVEPGVNDLSAGTTAAALAALTGTLVTNLATRFTPAVHLCTITTNESFDAAKQAERATYNATLSASPWGARDVFDTATAMAKAGDPNQLADAYDSGDGLHFSTAGHAAYAAALSRPVTTMPRGAGPARPSAVLAGAGATWIDTATHRPSWSDGAVWRDAAGSAT